MSRKKNRSPARQFDRLVPEHLLAWQMSRVAAILTNYNMPERTNALAERIHRLPNCDLFVVDNGSDIAEPSHFTYVWLAENCQTTGGWLAGLKAAKRMGHYDYYWFLITSAEFVDERDPLTPMVAHLDADPNAVGVHPALTADSTTAWEHLKARGGDQPRQTWMIDNIASLYRADWFDGAGGFDPEMKYAWGIDLETCWKARRDGRSLWVHEGVQVRKVTDIGYQMRRMNMSAEDRREKAGANMRDVLSARYGENWNWRMRNEYVLDEWR